MTTENEIFEYLDELRAGGGINMYPYIEKAVIPFSKWADRDYLGDRPDHRMVAWFEDGDVADPAAEYQRLLSLGVDGFVTDHPALVVSLLPGGH